MSLAIAVEMDAHIKTLTYNEFHDNIISTDTNAKVS